MGKLTLILGGARSGKSRYAQELARQSGKSVLYIATAQALDEEMKARIHAHRMERPQDWQTIEAPLSVANALSALGTAAQVIILDCLTLLVSNILMRECPNEDRVDEAAVTAAVDAETSELLAWIAAHEADWFIVSNEVGMGLVPPYPLGRVYRDVLGRANQHLAERADEVVLLVAGIPWLLRKR